MGYRRSATKAWRGEEVPSHSDVEPASILSIIDVCTDPELFGPWFKGQSWAAWFCFLKAMLALPLDEAELALFRQCTGRTAPLPGGYLLATLVIGRRGGKSLILALLAAYLACFHNWSQYLTGGERGVVMVIAADRKQATIIFRYLRAFLNVPLLKGMIVRATAGEIDLNNSVSIEIVTASFRTVRGRTVVAALCDELAFWMQDDGSANPDTEIIAALEPAMATIPRALLLKASSPYARRGVLWDDYRKNFARDDSALLVWQAPTRTMNPSVSQAYIDGKYEDDPARAAAEYGALFRTDVEALLTREAVEAVTAWGTFERPYISKYHYHGFTDPSGGSADSMTLAIAHLERGLLDSEKVCVVDVAREIRPPFSPEATVDEFAQLLRMYKISSVRGDRYAGEWPRERFRVHGISYEVSEKTKSDIYRDFLPIVNSKLCDLLDHKRLFNQLVGLERRTARGGRDSIDHAPGAHDDVANAVAGVVCQVRADSNQTKTRFIHLDYMGR
jgi:hypothetical protein